MTDKSNSTSSSLKAKGSSFQAMGLEMNLIKGLNRIGYKMPTPVQRKALPIALAGIDLVCMSRTGWLVNSVFTSTIISNTPVIFIPPVFLFLFFF